MNSKLIACGACELHHQVQKMNQMLVLWGLLIVATPLMLGVLILSVTGYGLVEGSYIPGRILLGLLTSGMLTMLWTAGLSDLRAHYRKS